MNLAIIIRDSVPLAELLERAPTKYGAAFNVMVPLRALVSFGDIEEGDLPVLYDESLLTSWQGILHGAVKGITR